MNRAERRRLQKRQAKTSGKQRTSSVTDANQPRVDELLARAYKAMQQASREDPDQLCAQVLEIQPENYDAWLLRGVLARRHKNFEAATQYLQKAISLNPKRADGHSNLGNVWRDQGDLQQAAACYQASLEINPDQLAALNNLSLVRRSLGAFESALQLAERALALNPDFTEGHINTGAALSCAGRYREALTHFEKARPSDPSYPSVASAVANCLVQLGETELLGSWISARASGPAAFLETIYAGEALHRALVSGAPSQRLGEQIRMDRVQPSGADGPVIYVSGDSRYLDRYLEPFCASFCDSGNRGRLHVHALVTGGDDLQSVRGRLDRYPPVSASLSSEIVTPDRQNRVYYSTARFAALAVLCAGGHLSGPVFAVDIDSLVRADLSPVWAHFKVCGASVGLFERKTEFVEQQIAAGAVYLAGDDGSRRFIEDVGAYICHGLMDRTPHWYLDQIALLMVRLHHQSRDPGVGFAPVPQRFLDWNQTPDGLIWTSKGGKDS